MPKKTNQRVTEAEADAIADMLEQPDLELGADVPREQWVPPTGRAGRGRPSLTAPGQHSPQIRIRIPATTKDELDELAETTGRSTSDLVRQAIEELLAHQR